jgi:tRNA (guanine37-N1)-methyltransferase
MRIDLVSIFPEYFAPLELSLLGRARADGLVDLRVHDLRAWTSDRHRTVDDTPYGGGAGMVMTPEPWGEALDAIIGDGSTDPVLVVSSPAGTPFDQRLAERLASESHLVFAAGRYEGIDQRVVTHYSERVRVEEVSIGDYILNGGEVAVMVMVEAVTRLLPGFMGNPASLAEESHHTGADGGLLEYPVYTKPATWRGLDVPDVLLSGHHARIARWRRDQSLLRTADVRPDLLAAAEPGLVERDREVLEGRERPDG